MSDTPDQEASSDQGELEDRTMESRPRRVILRRDENGSYCIFMGSRMIQGFCNEFEDVTGYALGINRQQQVRIAIEPIGRQLHARYPDDREPPPRRISDLPDAERTDPDVTRISLGEGASLFNAAHPGNPTVTMTWQSEARRGVQEQMARLQDILNLLESM